MIEQDAVFPEASLTDADRWIIGAALSDLAHALKNETASKSLVGRIGELRSQFIAAANLPQPPRHARIMETEFLKMMATLENSNTWQIYWTPDEMPYGDLYMLTAEVWSHDEQDYQFTIAKGLKGSGKFQTLLEEDFAFVEEIETFIKQAGPRSTGAQIKHAVVDISIPWEIFADNDRPVVVEEYIRSTVADKGDIGGYGVLALYIDVNTSDELANAGYAAVSAEVMAIEDDLARLAPMIARHEARLLEDQTPPNSP